MNTKVNIKTIKCVLFDLDGTLLDTSKDFAYALEQTCIEFNTPLVDFQKLRAIISDGGQAMIELAFTGLSEKEITVRKKYFLKTYSANIAQFTHLFKGLEQGMQSLADNGISWGIVTNKPEWLTQKLISQQNFPSAPCVVVSGDTLAESKPHPAPLLLAAKECKVNPEQCIYLGDHPRDILAGKNANMLTGVALFGFLSKESKPAEWQADINFKTTAEMSEFLKGIQ